jgi:hypothetical protein
MSDLANADNGLHFKLATYLILSSEQMERWEKNDPAAADRFRELSAKYKKDVATYNQEVEQHEREVERRTRLAQGNPELKQEPISPPERVALRVNQDEGLALLHSMARHAGLPRNRDEAMEAVKAHGEALLAHGEALRAGKEVGKALEEVEKAKAKMESAHAADLALDINLTDAEETAWLKHDRRSFLRGLQLHFKYEKIPHHYDAVYLAASIKEACHNVKDVPEREKFAHFTDSDLKDIAVLGGLAIEANGKRVDIPDGLLSRTETLWLVAFCHFSEQYPRLGATSQFMHEKLSSMLEDEPDMMKSLGPKGSVKFTFDLQGKLNKLLGSELFAPHTYGGCRLQPGVAVYAGDHCLTRRPFAPRTPGSPTPAPRADGGTRPAA